MEEKIEAMLQEYREGRISRREFIHQAIALTGSLAAATVFADALFAPSAYGAQVASNDPGLKSGDVQYPGKDGTVAGYLALAPDSAVAEYVNAGFSYLKSLPEVRGDRLGITGFCWGGGHAYLNATRVRGLRAAVIFYGETPDPVDLLERLETPVLAHYAERDKRITSGGPATEAAVKKYNKSYEYKIYPGAEQ